MRWLADAVWFVLALGLVEAVVKPISKLLVQRQVLRLAPLLLQRLDAVLPQWLLECDGAELEQRVRALAEELTGESWQQVDLAPLWQLFDPRICASRQAQRSIPSQQSEGGRE